MLIHAGDAVGASPPESALLQDEPTIMFLNMLANDSCRRASPEDPRCNMVGTVGNHEFDEGVVELRRLIYGGAHPEGPFLEEPWQGARFPYVSANVIDNVSGQPLFPPYTIVRAGEVRIGVVGAVLQDTPSAVSPDGVASVRFMPEADAINKSVRALTGQGVEAIVVTIHQGGEQASYEGPTDEQVAGPSGPLVDIVRELDGAVDVVISGHAHAFSNARLPTSSGQRALVTQAWSAGRAFAAIELGVDRTTGDVVSSSARIITTYADQAPGESAADVAMLVEKAKAATSTRVERVVGEAAAPVVCSVASDSGESALGDLIADAQRAMAHADIAFMNEGGIRADLQAGPITWGALFAIQPFGNALTTMTLSGAEVRAVLEQQFTGGAGRLQISGLRYTFRASASAHEHVLRATVDGKALVPDRLYRVVTNSFLAAGGDGYSTFTHGRDKVVGAVDLEALVAHVARLKGPLRAVTDGRIERVP